MTVLGKDTLPCLWRSPHHMCLPESVFRAGLIGDGARTVNGREFSVGSIFSSNRPLGSKA